MILNWILNWINFAQNSNIELNQFGYRTGLGSIEKSAPEIHVVPLISSMAESGLVVALFDTQIDSIQCLNFAQN